MRRWPFLSTSAPARWLCQAIRITSVPPPTDRTPSSSLAFSRSSSQPTAVSPSSFLATSPTAKPSSLTVLSSVQLPCGSTSSPPRCRTRSSGPKAAAISLTSLRSTLRDRPEGSSRSFVALSGGGRDSRDLSQNSMPWAFSGSRPLMWPGMSTSGITMMPRSFANRTISLTSSTLYWPSIIGASRDLFSSGKPGRLIAKRQKSLRCRCRKFMRTNAMPLMTSFFRASIGTKRRPVSTMIPRNG
mmetsp:Transcript_7747/g.22723  ORF Transcript_7747/g.22723 Transcript_7747/m.22723 type:complete len:243 (+) Transcript_7747:551-1279(+)